MAIGRSRELFVWTEGGFQGVSEMVFHDNSRLQKRFKLLEKGQLLHRRGPSRVGLAGLHVPLGTRTRFCPAVV